MDINKIGELFRKKKGTGREAGTETNKDLLENIKKIDDPERIETMLQKTWNPYGIMKKDLTKESYGQDDLQTLFLEIDETKGPFDKKFGLLIDRILDIKNDPISITTENSNYTIQTGKMQMQTNETGNHWEHIFSVKKEGDNEEHRLCNVSLKETKDGIVLKLFDTSNGDVTTTTPVVSITSKK